MICIDDVAISPFIDGSKVVTKVLKEDMEKLTGGKLIVEYDVEKAANELEYIVNNRRKSLNI